MIFLSPCFCIPEQFQSGQSSKVEISSCCITKGNYYCLEPMMVPIKMFNGRLSQSDASKRILTDIEIFKTKPSEQTHEKRKIPVKNESKHFQMLDMQVLLSQCLVI